MTPEEFRALPIDAQRARVVAIARTWLGTPYHTAGTIKKVGCDCASMPGLTYLEAGVIETFDLEQYPPDWHLHRSEERYMAGVLRHASEIDGPPLPGDFALWKFGRCFSHGAIVVKWPIIIHAYLGKTVQLENVDQTKWLRYIGENTTDKGKPRPVKFFSPWG